MLLWFILRALAATLRVPRALRRWLGLRSARGAQRRADKGFAAFFEGHWDVAEKALKKAGSPDEKHFCTRFMRRLQRYAGANQRVRWRYWNRPKRRVGTGLADRLGQGRMSSQGWCDWRGGAIVGAAVCPRTQNPRAKALRAEVAYLQRDWQPLTELLADVRQAGIAPDEQINVWERTTWIALLSEADDASTAVSVWKRAPESLKAPEQPLWPALLDILRQDAQAVRCSLKRMRCRGCSGTPATALRTGDAGGDDWLTR
ncbi:MAG: hypothetical protein CM15mP25_5350 [Gammaproteobacteria bacterium]|nr:MAG: hypothetical protein CM15mP25_5350 [Gammaproteobacteria bacterium]